ncbi:MAG: hypothetical protein H0X24_20495 [Ktedonobacterales bacterium]|nr:hypothetical protein [Ktedonobacterales bacterium]
MSSDWPMPPLLPAPGGSNQRSQSLPRRSTPLSPTGALRARQRMDAATQATSELSVLTEQLLDLPARLLRVNLAAAKAQQLHEAMEAFAELAALAYMGMADSQLHEVASSALYRQRAVAASRRISRLQQEAAISRPLPDPLTDLAQAVKGQNPSRRAPLWRLRIRLYHEALNTWRAALGADQGGASALPAYGRALEQLRAAVGYAGIPTALAVIMRIFIFLALLISGLITAVTVGAAASSLTLGQGATALHLSSTASAFVGIWGLAYAWTTAGRLNLRTVMGATRWRLVERERATALGLLSGWAWFAASLGLVGVVSAVGYAGWLFAGTLAPHGALAGTHDLASALRLGAGQPLDLLAALAGVVLVLPLLFALPFVLVYQGMHGREMARGSARLPQARRVAASFALPLLACPTLIVLSGALASVPRLPALAHPFVACGPLRLSWIAALVAGSVVLPYLVALVVPFNLGIRRWRGARLRDAQAQQQDLSAKLERLAPEPDLGADVTGVQYDVARLQYLRLHTEELRRERATPFAAGEGIAAFIILVVVAVLADSGLALAMQQGLGRFL